MTFETFARRKRQESRKGEPEIYTYDQAPEHMRYQIYWALEEGIGKFDSGLLWQLIDRVCLKELPSYRSYAVIQGLAKRFLRYVTETEDIDDFLSAVEIGCVSLSHAKDIYNQRAEQKIELKGADPIDEINARFEQHAVGYRFENGRIIRVDSKLVHAEVIKPALVLLTEPAFAKANDDFMAAHRHYRTHEFKDCVTAANRAFESMLKAICELENWEYNRGDRAAELVTKVRAKGLFTHNFDRSFDAYIHMLRAGLPTIRNDAGGHGEGLATATVTAQIARFAMNLAASNMLFLGECYAAIKRS